jgi:hypothetical protein
MSTVVLSLTCTAALAGMFAIMAIVRTNISALAFFMKNASKEIVSRRGNWMCTLLFLLGVRQQQFNELTNFGIFKVEEVIPTHLESFSR